VLGIIKGSAIIFPGFLLWAFDILARESYDAGAQARQPEGASSEDSASKA